MGEKEHFNEAFGSLSAFAIQIKMNAKANIMARQPATSSPQSHPCLLGEDWWFAEVDFVCI